MIKCSKSRLFVSIFVLFFDVLKRNGVHFILENIYNFDFKNLSISSTD